MVGSKSEYESESEGSELQHLEQIRMMIRLYVIEDNIIHSTVTDTTTNYQNNEKGNEKSHQMAELSIMQTLPFLW